MSADQLLKEASQLSLPELDQLVSNVIRLRANRVAPGLPFREAELLQQINRSIPAELRQRLGELYEKRDSEQLNEREHDELKRLVLQVEQIEAERIGYLTELAALRGTTLTALMEQLGLGGAAHV